MTHTDNHSKRKRSMLGTLASACVILILAVPGRTLATQEDFESLIVAERTFSADAQRIGIAAAFRAHVAADGVLIRPDPKPAAPILAAERDEEGVRLEWQPAVAAIARSNDLGFTMGPYHLSGEGKLFTGYFLTIWERAPKGRWQWYLDHGLPYVAQAEAPPLPQAVLRLRDGVTTVKLSRPGLAESEDRLNAALVAGNASTVADRMAQDGYLLRPGRDPIASADARTLFALEGPVAAAERLGMRVSKAGDLAASYGRISRRTGKPAAHYVRVWRLDAEGWRLLIDEVV